jgi:hypothetical protein|tara:strand:+ start:314 stop:676 length:363 start_codon:yes stop_codon:yes gene_type:complete
MKMGFSWWFDSEDVSTESFFKFLPRKYDPNLEYASSSERVFLEKKILDPDRSNPQSSVHSELIRLSEKEKDQILNSMALCVEQCLGDSKSFNIPHSEELLSSELLEILDRTLKIRKKLVK